MVDPQASAAEEIQTLAQELLPLASEIAGRVFARVLEVVPEVSPGGHEIALRSTQQNIAAMLSTLAFGQSPESISPPPATLTLLGQVGAAGGEVTTVLHAYRVGHQSFWDIWSEHLAHRTDDTRRLQALTAESSRRIFALFDSVIEGLVATFRAEFGQLATGPNHPRSTARTIDALLRHEPFDLDAATTTLGYDVRGHHVAVILAPLSSDGPGEDALIRLVPRIDGRRPLTSTVGDGSVWAWLQVTAQSPGNETSLGLAQISPSGVVVSVGRPGTGRDGFRKSHEQAREAERVARLAVEPREGVVYYRDVALASVLCADLERARRFANESLGALAGEDDATAKLRETLRIFIAHGHNKVRTAEALVVHQKTVAYRIARIETMIGHPITDDAADLQAGLLIHKTLYGT